MKALGERFGQRPADLAPTSENVGYQRGRCYCLKIFLLKVVLVEQMAQDVPPWRRRDVHIVPLPILDQQHGHIEKGRQRVVLSVAYLVRQSVRELLNLGKIAGVTDRLQRRIFLASCPCVCQFGKATWKFVCVHFEMKWMNRREKNRTIAKGPQSCTSVQPLHRDALGAENVDHAAVPGQVRGANRNHYPVLLWQQAKELVGHACVTPAHQDLVQIAAED